MKREVRVEETYPHPPELVWRALTEPELIRDWLMDNDFEARVGHQFTLRTDPQPGFDGIVHCEVLELDPPRRMRWSWVGGPIDTVVAFELTPASLADGRATRLVVRQSGFEGLPAVLVSFIMGSGSRSIYGRALPDTLDRLAGRAPRPRPPRRMTAPWRFFTALFAPILRRANPTGRTRR